MLRRFATGYVGLAALLLLAGAPKKFWWTTFQGDAAHTGYVAVSLNPRHFTLDWERTLSNRELNPVTAAEGKVFVSEISGFLPATLFVLKAATGKTMWSVDLGENFSVNPPSYGYGNVYIQTGYHAYNTYLRAYDADTGDLVFRSPHAAQWEGYYAPTVSDGTVYINGGYYGGMYAFDAFTGDEQWFAQLPQYDQWTPAVDSRHAYAYVGEYSPGLYVFDRRTGDPLFTIPDQNFEWNGWSMRLAPALGSRENLLAIHDGRLISFDLANRRIGWEIQRSFIGQPSLSNGRVFAVDAGALSVRNEATGEVEWNWESSAESLIAEPILVTKSHVFVQSSANLYAVDLVRREATWSYPVTGHLTYAEGTLYVAGIQGILTAIRLHPVRGGGSDR